MVFDEYIVRQGEKMKSKCCYGIALCPHCGKMLGIDLIGLKEPKLPKEVK